MTFDSKITFEKHHRLVSRAASQRIGILRKPCRVFHDRLLLERCFLGFVLLVLDYCSVVWCSAADTHLKLLDRAVSGARFLTGGVFDCDTAHLRSVAVLCMLNQIRCDPMHPLNDALHGPHGQCGLHAVPWSHIGILMRPLAAVPRSTARLLFPSQCPSGRILLTPYSMVRDWRVSSAGPMLFQWPKLLYPYYTLPTNFPFLFFLFISWYCGPGVFGLIGCIPLSLSHALPTSFNNNNDKIITVTCNSY